MSNIKIKMKQEHVDEIRKICKSFRNEPGELINVLHKTQGFLGYLPAEAQELIALELNVPLAKVYGVVTFYSFFSMIPKGRHPISVCMGTACYVRGAEKIMDELKSLTGIKPGETDKEGKFSLVSLRCVGACGLAPVVLIGEKVYGRLATEDVAPMLAEYDECSCGK
jgi:NADH-quinone oxidoreductase subunit E/NADP-reducing hydrogenase subunit HndA